jgi:hypothetical protein
MNTYAWNVIIVNKHGFPRKPSEEFQVKSDNISGAARKAENKIKKDFPDWKIRSIWWLDPKAPRRE